jgi:hypothetical protein
MGSYSNDMVLRPWTVPKRESRGYVDAGSWHRGEAVFIGYSTSRPISRLLTCGRPGSLMCPCPVSEVPVALALKRKTEL